MGTKATVVYAVKRISDDAWYGPGRGRSFGFGGARVSMFETPGKAQGVISRMTVDPAKYQVMMVDLSQAVPYVK